ncbi:MAG: PD40 domain-containing protein [Candidatus Krumholzibacteriota bacterium]|nr:PD40 domain-containing protein [Candidatus Krumholzibacteriota bacterium]
MHRITGLLLFASLLCLLASRPVPAAQLDDREFILSLKDVEIVNDLDLSRLREIYLRDPAVPNNILSAFALSQMESEYLRRIQAGGKAQRFIIENLFAENAPANAMNSRFTLESSLDMGSGGTVYTASFPAVSDQLVKTRLNPLPHLSTVRFSGRVPFPLQVEIGSLDGGTLVWAPPEQVEKYGVTNSTMLTASPAAGSYLFEGDPADPLTFILLDELGFVYLHGRGKVTLPDKVMVELPAVLEEEKIPPGLERYIRPAVPVTPPKEKPSPPGKPIKTPAPIEPKKERAVSKVGEKFPIGRKEYVPGGHVNLTVNGADDHTPAWSPDGEHLAYDSNREGNDDIWIYSLKSKRRERITRDSGDENEPRWSFDGSAIIYAYCPESFFRGFIHRISPAGKKKKILSDTEIHGSSLILTRDLSRILFKRFKIRDNRLSVLTLASGEVTVFSGADHDFSLAPDDNRVVYASIEQPREIFLTDIEGLARDSGESSQTEEGVEPGAQK